VHSIGSLIRKSFYLFRDIVDGNQDIFTAL
jgi:hypothetical protein